jgi:hypothetical protein
VLWSDIKLGEPIHEADHRCGLLSNEQRADSGGMSAQSRSMNRSFSGTCRDAVFTEIPI